MENEPTTFGFLDECILIELLKIHQGESANIQWVALHPDRLLLQYSFNFQRESTAPPWIKQIIWQCVLLNIATLLCPNVLYNVILSLA